MPPHFGQGPALLLEKVTFVELSTQTPEANAVPQVSQNAGIDGISFLQDPFGITDYDAL
jgi:hypothetical protein